MIEQAQEEIQAVKCPKCDVPCPKSGKRPDGLQRYRCSRCGKTFSQHRQQQNVFATKQAVDDAKALLALQLLVEGNSIRSAERISGIHRDTIMGLLLKAGERSAALLNSKIQNVPATDVQCDEIWTFVRKKRGSRRGTEKDYAYIGDAWTFIAIDRNTKLVLTHLLGLRTLRSTMMFIEKLAAATSAEQRFQLTTDGMNHYAYAIGMLLDGRVDYAQLIKIYEAPTAEERRRYSPPRIAETHKTDVYGDPDFDLVCTSHVERQNGSLRQWCKRLTRLTYAFSKKWENLDAALALHFAYYNFCRVHKSIRMTPAMKAGLTDHVWTIRELLSD